MRLPRTTGALSGVLIVLLGVWGALIPFIGPYFHYAFGSYQTWDYTTSRLWLEIVPGVVAVIGGLMLLTGARRTEGIVGGCLAVAAGIWFAIGPVVALLWHYVPNPTGAPMGGHTRQMLEFVGYFYGLGVAITGLAAFAMGRYFSRPRVIEEPVVAATAVATGVDVAREAEVGREAEVVRTGDTGTIPATEGGAVGAADAGTVPARDPGAVEAADAGTVPARDPGAVGAADAGTVAARDPGTVPVRDPGAVGTADAGTVPARGPGAIGRAEAGTLPSQRAVSRRRFGLFGRRRVAE
jgi:hypothetical protein